MQTHHWALRHGPSGGTRENAVHLSPTGERCPFSTPKGIPVSIDIDARTSEPPVLDRQQAARLDEQIQDMADKAGEHLDYLFDLLAEAQEGQIHQALQFDSWTAYLVDRLKPIAKALDADDRHALVAELYEAGMSVRAIAEAVGTSKSTVARQVSQSGTGDNDGEAVKATGMDGKAYTRRNHGGGYRGELKPHMRLNRAVKAIEGIDVAAAKDQTELRQQLQDTRNRICELIDERLDNIQSATESN